MNEVPVPVIIVERSGEFLHLVDGDGEADEDEHDCESVQPMIVSVEFLLACIDCLFMRLEFILVDDTLHCLHILILYEVLLVDLLVEDVAEQEGDR